MIRDSGAASVVSDVNTIAIGSAGSVDLRNNSMIVRTMPLGAWNSVTNSYTGVLGFVDKGRNAGMWDGSGGLLTTLTAADSPSFITTLAVAAAGDVGKSSFAGRSVDADDVLVMYTYGGDANLDGAVNADDYFRISTGYSRGARGFSNGDFDYSGSIDGDDFFIIDTSFSHQNGSLAIASAPSVEGVTSVPEPSSLLAVAASMLLARRRR
jgi:hypothetical protein